MKVTVVVVVIGAGLLFSGCRSTREPPEDVTHKPSAAAERREDGLRDYAASKRDDQSGIQPPAGAAQAASPPAIEESEAQPPFPPEPGRQISLFDGATLGRWKATDFGGQGDVYVRDGAIHMEMGSYMTGITWTGPVVRMNYEITLDAMRVQGNDFFCALTFPVGENPCTLVLGGWGGSVCGLSNIDYFDASENETTRLISFKTGTWYRVRLRVVPDRIQAWVDDEQIVDVETTGHKIDIRIEVDLCRPLGIATWMTTGAVRNIRLETLPEPAQ